MASMNAAEYDVVIAGGCSELSSLFLVAQHVLLLAWQVVRLPGSLPVV
jgi:hypothetical protein